MRTTAILTLSIMTLGLSATSSFIPTAQAEGRLREILKERIAERRAAGGSGHLGENEGGLKEKLAAMKSGSSGGMVNLSCEKLVKVMDKNRGSGLEAATKPEFGDIAYGSDPLQTIDVYRADKKDCPISYDEPLPIIVMVHGGAWCIGDKSAGKVVDNKYARWAPKGFIFISINNRMIPDGADPYAQATDVANAMAYIQSHATEWNGDPKKIILMGHSAGAHLVSLVSTSGEIKRSAGLKPWLGTISLDSAVMNVPEMMEMKHYAFYDDAFGADKKFWIKTSPYHQISTSMTLPWLGVCGTGRPDSCPQAHAFATKLGKGQVLEEDMNHGEINDLLGVPGPYTDAVEAFMGSLDPVVKKHLTSGVKSVEHPEPIENPIGIPNTDLTQ